MLVLTLALSYAPAMYRDTAEWPRIREWLAAGAPQPLELAQETPEVVDDQKRRIDAAFASLRDRLHASRPDALLCLATDSGRLFTGVQVPQLATYLGQEIWGSTRFAELGEEAEDDIVRLPCAAELAASVHQDLVGHGFEMSYSQVLRPMGQPEFGAPASLVASARALLAGAEIPIIPVFVNCHVPPAPNGRRCYALGDALAEILEERDERVAVVACGGLSHDHEGPRGGWLDEPLDRWALKRFERGKGSDLRTLFDLDSDALRGGAAELRLWTAAAAAAERGGGKARVVDYIPSYSAATGLGFAYWPAD